ncbi:MAG: GvpL/GvpF family gas vesicle protein [Candidatus Binatia bacterium]|nr:GvpL/GvpF family gas vesicle protein [Candidatus Binatia bacterium]
MNEPTGLWIYCVIENRGTLNWDAQGVHGTSPVYTVAFGEFAMVVSKEPMKKYPLTRDFLMAHQRVNENVMQTQPVLPVKFCTMATNNEQIIEQVLKQKERVEEFRKTFAKLRGKTEYGLRARWKNLDQVFSDLIRHNERVKAAKEKVLNLPEAKRQAALIDVGHVVKDAVEEKNAATAESLDRELSPHAAQYKNNHTLGDANILNAVFLVEQDKQAEFDATVNALVEKHECEIHFKYVGPAPPFNFVEIVIRWDTADKTAADNKERVVAELRD